MVLLIADDESYIRQGLLTIDWKEIGIKEVYEAANGLEVKRILEKKRIDIILCDIRMPGMTGLEIAEYVYRNAMNTKVILLTGFNDFEYAKAAISNQVLEYLLKPISTNELLSAVQLAMEQIALSNYKSKIVAEYEEKVGSYTTIQQITHCFRNIDTQAYEIIKYIAESFEEEITLQKLSDQYYLSSVYLSRYIKKETGYSFVDILTCIRILNAIKLLEDGKYQIAMICDMTGFRDQRYFSQIFKRLIGCKPNEYRKNVQKQRDYSILELLDKKCRGTEE
jgi:YesN/AraC family two-component response regulator